MAELMQRIIRETAEVGCSRCMRRLPIDLTGATRRVDRDRRITDALAEAEWSRDGVLDICPSHVDLPGIARTRHVRIGDEAWQPFIVWTKNHGRKVQHAIEQALTEFVVEHTPKQK